jgi:inorganic pyrophosphatase
VPSTVGDDGDPLDVLVLMDSAAFTGCIVTSRLIGVIEGEQTENGQTFRNDRLIAVAAKSITHRSLRDISDVSDDLVGRSSTSSFPTQHGKGQDIRAEGAFRTEGERRHSLGRECHERAADKVTLHKRQYRTPTEVF